MKKISVFLLSLLFICLFTACYSYNLCYAETPSSAKSMAVIEGNSRRLLYSKNCDEKLAMASTTKIATALTVLNNCEDINKEVAVSDLAVGIEGTSMYLRKGETLSIKDLLYGMMLPSGNDASMALAIAIGGTKDKFIDLMNEEAKKAGAFNTNFMNPHGLDEKGHYTTAHDLALITAKAMENETFREIVNTKSVKIKGSEANSYRFLRSKNKLFNMNEYCTGVKTGFTDNAGRCFVGCAEKDGMRVISVVLNCGPMFEECNTLINKAFDEYKINCLLEPYKYQKKIPVKNGKQEDVKVFTRNGFSYPLKLSELSKVEIIYEVPNYVEAPIKKEAEIGELKIYFDNCLLFSEKIYTMEDVKEIGLLQNIKDIVAKW